MNSFFFFSGELIVNRVLIISIVVNKIFSLFYISIIIIIMIIVIIIIIIIIIIIVLGWVIKWWPVELMNNFTRDLS